jgi:hypothetical protein
MAMLSKVLIDLFGHEIGLRPSTTAQLRTLVDSFGDAAEPATRGIYDSFGDSLAPVAGDPTGGKFAVWREGPVIYFGTEGQVYVAASSLDAFLGVLAYESHVFDLMGYWHRVLSTIELERQEWFVPERPSVNPAIADALGGIAVPADPSAVVEPRESCVAVDAARYRRCRGDGIPGVPDVVRRLECLQG